jgi:hypothetical protein
MSQVRQPYRRDALRWLSGALAGAAAWPLWAAATPAQRLALQRAERRKDALQALADQLASARGAAQALARQAEQTGAAWQQAQAREVDARQAMQRAVDEQPALHQAMAAALAALQALSPRVAQSHQAVRALAEASPEQLSAAAAAADAAFSARDRAERALQQAQGALLALLAAHRQQVARADQAVQSLLEALRLLDERAARLGPLAQQLHREWQGVLSREQQAVQQAGWVARAPALPAPATRAQHALALALQGLSAGNLASDLTVLRTLAGPEADLVRLAEALLRLQDAAAYLQTVSAPPGGACETPACRVLASDTDSLRLPTARAHGALQAAQDRHRDAAAGLGAVLVRQQDRLAQATALVQSLGPQVASALEEARAPGEAVLAQARSLQPVIEAELVLARREWAAAYRAVHGQPPNELSGQFESASLAMPPPAPRPAMAAPQRELRSHAYALFASRQGEPTGFGAYTYVLLRSGADLRQPAVRQRLVQVLEVVRRQVRAGDVPADLAPRVNLFCVPNRLADDPRATDEAPTEVLADAYLPELGQQLLVRAQSGLLTRTEVSKRLTGSPGPFLLTLPGRIGESSSGTPLLLADLSDYPEAAITDLVTHYMDGLVDDFPQKQALWRPSVLQSVALAVIHLPQQASQVVTSLLPTAQARPPSR